MRDCLELLIDEQCAIDSHVALANLKARWENGLGYTSAGEAVLIAINTYKRVKREQDDATRDQFLQHNRIDLEPHIYGISSALYWYVLSQLGMIEKLHTQHAVVLHGESNSGKSYNANAILNHLTAFIELHSTEQKSSRPLTLRRQVKCCSIILKSIGCARTRLTKHSTQYAGAYTLHFNSSTSQLSHVSIQCSLLEQGRVTGHIRGEQVYTVFHELLSAPAEFKKALLLAGKSCDDFGITKRNSSSSIKQTTATAESTSNTSEAQSSSGVTRQTSSTHADSFTTTLEAMQDIGLSKHAIQSYYSVIAAILHLCEVEFRQPTVYEGSIDKSFGLDVIGEQHLEHAATLLQCDIDELSNALMYKTVSVEQKTQGSSSSTSYTSSGRSKQRTGSKRSEQDVAFTVPATEREAWFLKDMLCKQLYTMAFEWMLQQLNTELSQANSSSRDNQAYHSSIQVYDMFGIEQLDVPNKLEQLCINYANERLQQQYIITFTTINEEVPCLHAMRGFFGCLERECALAAASTPLTPSLDSILNNYNDDDANDTTGASSTTNSTSTVNSNNSDRAFMSSAMSSNQVYTTIDTHGNRIVTQ
eukprot:10994-Heterococcus_DN1.PRE.3